MGMGRGNRTQAVRYTKTVKTWPRPVASAAPRIPISGKMPMPKIMRGSRMILARQPHRRLAMVVFIRPAAWKIFSKDRLSMMMTEKAKAMREY